MYDISEKGEKQFKRVERLIWGLYILIPVLLLTTGCGNASFNDTDIYMRSRHSILQQTIWIVLWKSVLMLKGMSLIHLALMHMK